MNGVSCYLRLPKIRMIHDELKENAREQVLDELLKQKSDEELH
ncbi:MAG: hypothetical protein R3255_09110 [Candidatus Lokiarchaeia archaeon]|nr:hypothetical protein [Candidatus Lokiarchaeia archaeon]